MKKLTALRAALILGAACLSSSLNLQAAGAEPGFKSLFNGKDLTGWEGRKNHWSVEDGAITGTTSKENPAKGNNFLIAKDGDKNLIVDDFELRFAFKFTGDFGNSGVQYRSKDFDNYVVGGYQADFEVGLTYSGILYEERMTRGIMAARGEKVVWGEDGKKEVVGKTEKTSAEIQEAIRTNGWNSYVVIAKGNRLQHFINGNQTVDVVDLDPKKQVRSGILAFQIHAGPPMKIQFKDISIKSPSTASALTAEAVDKKIVLVAGPDSHGAGSHAHRAGCTLFKAALDKVPGVKAEVYTNGWPKDASALDGAAAVVIYSDGGGGHPFIQGDRLKVLEGLMKQGVGLGCVHYAVEVPKDRGGKEWLNWIGGYFETHWSVNPFWEADFKSFPDHPVSRGVKPFKSNDEWYYHMRFPEGMKGVTPILSALPPANTLDRPDGPHSNNPGVRAAVLERKEPQHLLWVYERTDGSRGFGFTGGHSHKNWTDPNFRRAVLNAIVWTAKIEVPAGGVEDGFTTADVMAFLK